MGMFCVVLQTSPGHLQPGRLGTGPLPPPCGDRCGQVVGACLWRDPASTRIGAIWEDSPVSPTGVRGAARPCVERSQARTAVRPCAWVLPTPLQSPKLSVQPRKPLARSIPTPLFPATPGFVSGTSPPRCCCHLPRWRSAGGSLTAFRNPIGASSICGLSATCCRRERRRPRVETISSGSPARISAVTIAQTTTCTALRAGCFSRSRGRCVTTSASLPAFAAGHRAVSNQTTESIQRRALNAVRHPILEPYTLGWTLGVWSWAFNAAGVHFSCALVIARTHPANRNKAEWSRTLL